MEGIEMEDTLSIPTPDDFCDSIISRFNSSTEDHHQHLCTVVGAMAQELKDQNLPPTPISYVGAASSSLDRLTSSDPDPPSHVVEALLTILSLALPGISPAILRKKREVLSEIVVRVLRLNSLTIGAVTSGLKCIGLMLVVKDTANWNDVCGLYGVLLGYIVDSRPKVRRQASISIRDVLQSFQGTSVLAPASERITNMFERFLLLAGGSNGNEAEKPRGAQEVLYILDTLKDGLPLMSMKCKTTILKYYKTLLELRQTVVTRRVTDSLNVICLQPTSDVSAEALLDLLCSLALYASSNETSVDNMTFTARLLDSGMRKVQSLNRQICVVKLPLVFSTLKDIMASEHEESIFAAMEAFKSLINNCIDESLIKQGVEQLMITTENGRMSGPTVIEKLCVTTESLLDYHYNAVWDMVFQVVSTMFDKLGENSSYFMKGTLKNLADMQGLSDDDFPHRKQLNECLGSALGAMGPETFLGIIPLNVEADELSEVNVWLFPILKQYTVGAHLSFFKETVLGTVGLMRQKSRKFELEGRTVAARSVDALIYSLWSLLPSFCNYPLDTAKSFKNLIKSLTSALREECEIRGIICNAIQILIQQNKVAKEDDLGVSEVIAIQRAIEHYKKAGVAVANLEVLKSSASEFLTVLSGILLESSNDDGGCVQSTITEIASIADRDLVSRIFLKTMQKLLKITQNATKVEGFGNSNSMQIDGSSNKSQPSLERAHLFDLAVSLLPGLKNEEIGVLYSALKPALQDSEGLIQKKAYKVLSTIIQKYDGFITSGIEELLQLMIDVLPACHFSARRHRLDCLYFLILHVIKGGSEQKRHRILSAFLTEIILALKEANKKTRNRSYDMLVQIGHACGDEENGGNKENLYQFFNMIAGGLAGETPHVVSAAVKGLARLAYEFSDLVATAYKLLPSTFLLLQRKNREIIKANLGLLKVLVAKSQSDGLQMHLRSLVEGILKWQGNTKSHFKAKVKHLLEMLVRKCGMDAVKAVMPEEHMRLLTNIRKIKERKEKKLANSDADSEEVRSHLSRATTSRISKWNHSKIFSDFGEEDSEDSDAEYMGAKTVSGRESKGSKSKAASLRSKKLRKSEKSLPDDLFDQLEDEPLDLLDRHKTRSALRSSGHLKRKQESDDEMEIDSEGRLIIHEGGKPKKEKPSYTDSDARSETGSQVRRKAQKRQKTSDSGWAYTGKEYSSKKAGGDVKKKDKLEPYAYWPLDRKMMSRRPEQRAAARKGMASVVNMTRKLQGKSVSSALSMKFTKFKTVKKGNKRKSK
ncbi:ARM repeat superfamily protein [Euphorbia peplus]|nr:ARM repeat superfamily protein [Euphorbia peplus]